MAKTATKQSVKGGWIARSAKTGRFVSVGKDGTVSKKSEKSASIIKSASSKRSAALARLKDR